MKKFDITILVKNGKFNNEDLSDNELKNFQ